MQTKSDFRTVRLPLDEVDSIEISAKVAASVTTFREGVDRWAEMKVLVTPNRMFIAQVIGMSSVQGEKSLIRTAMVHSIPALKNFLGEGKLAKRLLSHLRIK